MNSKEFEEEFFQELLKNLKKEFPNLDCELNSETSVGVGPDITIFDKEEKAILGIEIKGGPKLPRVPMATLAQMNAIKKKMKDARLVLLTHNSSVPKVVKLELGLEDVGLIEEDDPKEATDRILEMLFKLQK